MTVGMLTVLVTLAAVPLAHTILRIAALALHPRAGDAPSTRAGILFVRAVAPAMGAISVACGLVLPAFVIFEPAHDGERVGPVLIAMAAIGAIQISRMALRFAAMLRLSRRITAGWRRGARELPQRDWGLPTFAIDAGFPVVAVSGLARPTLFVDRQVIAACSRTELAAIAAHERAHVHAWDNARRLLLGACVGPTSAAASAWREAAEHAADARAADCVSRGVELAGALVKIARLAPARSFDVMALSTIHDGGTLETRIHYLLADRPAPRNATAANLACGAAALASAAVAGLNWTALLSSLHGLIELAVRQLL